MKCKLIRGGFSFCGVDIAELGLSYAPEKENTYVYRPTDVDVHQETFDGHDGGYLYGVTRKPKEFILRCYFENEAIDRGIMEKIYWLFRTGKTGKLVFSRKPWCYYYACVTSSPHPELSNYLNGMITITMTASYPFARGDAMYYDPTEDKDPQEDIKIKENDFVLVSTALVDKEVMIPEMTFHNITASVSEPIPIILHNPGTERAPLSIMISGNVGRGVIIRNNTTKQECKVVAMTKQISTDLNKYLYIDGINGNTSLIGDTDSKPAFLYHDFGFIALEPAYPALRNVYIDMVSGYNITLTNTLYQDVEGQYIYINNKWYRIEEQISEKILRVNEYITETYPTRTMITRMNELEIIPIDNIDLSLLSFKYKPTYA